MENEEVNFVVFNKKSFIDWPKLFTKELEELSDHPKFSTSFLILPWLDEDFESYLDVLDLSQFLMEENQWDEKFQLASFHPNYQFAGTQADEPSNKTNRSPHALIHLLKIDEVTKAIDLYVGETESIPTRNIALMNKLFGKKK